MELTNVLEKILQGWKKSITFAIIIGNMQQQIC
jgi:hypothetical protein